MTVARKGHGEMRRTGAPRETPSCARLFLCSFPIFPHKPVLVAHTHACHGKSAEIDSEAFRVVTSQHASSASAPASGTDIENSANTMSPIPDMQWKEHEVVPKPSDPEELILEAWAQGYLVGSLIIMAFITLANMRRGVLLHKVSREAL